MRRVISIGVFYMAFLVRVHGTDIVGPRLGYLWDPGARAFQPIEGIPGASFLSSSVDPGLKITDAAICQNLGYVLAVAAENRVPYVLRIGAGGFVPGVIEGAPHPVDRMALSPSGTSAVLYDASGPTLQIVTGLPGKPAVTREITGRTVDRMAVSDDGALVLLASGDALEPAFLSGASAEALAIPVSGPVSAMAFRPQSHDALIAAAGRITLVRAVDTNPTYEIFEDAPDPPVALAFSNNGVRFFAAYADGKIRTRDLASGESSAATCPCVPSGLQALDDSVFGLNQAGQKPLFLFDGMNNRIVFVARGDQ